MRDFPLPNKTGYSSPLFAAAAGSCSRPSPPAPEQNDASPAVPAPSRSHAALVPSCHGVAHFQRSSPRSARRGLAQPACSRATYSRLQRTLSRRVLNISREGDSTASLGSLFQCSVTLRRKKFFLMFRRPSMSPIHCTGSARPWQPHSSGSSASAAFAAAQ